MMLELSGLLKTSPDDPVGRKLNAVFAFSFALISIANQNLIYWLLSFIPNASIAVLAFFLLALVISLTGKKIPGIARALLAFLVIGIVLWLAVNALEYQGSSNYQFVGVISYVINYLVQSGLLAILIIFLLLFLTIYWVVSGGEKKEEKGGEEEKTPIIITSK
jgi:Na+/proline symporter